jgi:hypothetical protein
MLLAISSLSYLIAAIRGAGHWYGNALACLSLLSVINHGVRGDFLGRRVVARMTRIIAHALAAGTAVTAIQQPISMPITVYWMSLCNVTVCYYCLIRPFRARGYYMDHWHAYIHVMGATGMLSLTRALESGLKNDIKA